MSSPPAGIIFGKDDLPVDGPEWLIDAAVQRPGLVLVASRPAMGRSAFLHRFLLRSQRDTALFSPLLTTGQVTLRLIAMQSGVSVQDLKLGQLHRPAGHAAFDAVNVLAERGLRFFTGTSLEPVTTYLGSLAARPRTEETLLPPLLVIDDLEALVGPDGRGAALNTLQALAHEGDARCWSA